MSGAPATFSSFDLGELGGIMLAQCHHPESNGETWDLPLGIQCPHHNRTLYYCDDNHVLWCDGFQGGTAYIPHELHLVLGPTGAVTVDVRVFEPVGEGEL